MTQVRKVVHLAYKRRTEELLYMYLQLCIKHIRKRFKSFKGLSISFCCASVTNFLNDGLMSYLYRSKGHTPYINCTLKFVLVRLDSSQFGFGFHVEIVDFFKVVKKIYNLIQ